MMPFSDQSQNTMPMFFSLSLLFNSSNKHSNFYNTIILRSSHFWRHTGISLCSKASLFLSQIKTLGAFAIEFIASVRAFQIEEEFFLSLSRRGEKPLEVQFRTQASLLGAECSSYACVHLWLGFPVPPNIFQAWGYTRIRHHQRARESPAIIVALRSYPIRMQCLISTHIRE